MSANSELKEAVSAMYRLALAACQTREQCMDLSVDIRSMINRLDRIAEEECYDRALECDTALSRDEAPR